MVISLRKEKEDRLLEKQKLKKESEEKEIMRKINAANSLISLNVKAWASLEDTNNGLSKLENDEEKFKVLSAQLNLITGTQWV